MTPPAARRTSSSTDFSLPVRKIQRNGRLTPDRAVDVADFTVWRDTLGSAQDLRADGGGSGGVPDGVIDEHDHNG